jgi:hypothetical protein
MGIILAGLALFLLLIGNHGIPGEVKRAMRDDFKALLDAQWEKVKPAVTIKRGEDPGLRVFWQYRISPPFPSCWPPDASLQLIYYVYAGGLSPSSLVDGEYVAAPWGRVEVDRKGKNSPQFILLTSKIKEIGIQGVRPLREEEKATYENRESAEAFLANLTALPDKNDKSAVELRRYYCMWAKFNGAMIPELRSLHKGFFQWLDCRGAP